MLPGPQVTLCTCCVPLRDCRDRRRRPPRLQAPQGRSCVVAPGRAAATGQLEPMARAPTTTALVYVCVCVGGGGGWGGVWSLSLSLSIYIYIYVCLSLSLSVSPCLCLSVCLSLFVCFCFHVIVFCIFHLFSILARTSC